MDRRRTTIALASILVVALLLRLYKVTALALWFDEADSLILSAYPWSQLLPHIRADIAAPLYFVVLKLWCAAFGQSVLALRLLSVSFGVLSVWVIFLFVREAFGNVRLALVSALLLAVNPFQLEYAHETRMYAMGVFMVVLASYLLARAIRRGRAIDWLQYALAAAACLYTHYYLVFSVVSQAGVALGAGLAAPAARRRKMLTSVVGTYAVAGMLFAAWLPAFLEQQRLVGQDFWVRPLQLKTILSIPWSLLFGSAALWAPLPSLALVAGAALVVIALSAWRARSWGEWVVLAQALVPIAAGLVLSIHRPIFVERYFTFASAFWSILVAGVALMLVRPLPRRAVVTALVVVTLGVYARNLYALGLVALRHAPLDPPGVAGASEYINRHARPGDAIVVSNSLIYFSFNYYNRAMKPVLYSTGPLETIPVYAGRSILNRDELVSDLRGLCCPRRVWYLWTDGFYSHITRAPRDWRLVKQSRFADAPEFKGTIFVGEYLLPPVNQLSAQNRTSLLPQ